METVRLRVVVVEPTDSLVELGSTPLVVPLFYGLSNAIDGSVLTIRSRPDVACTVRLMTSETSAPSLGQLVTEEDSHSQHASGLQRHDSAQRRGRSNECSFGVHRHR